MDPFGRADAVAAIPRDCRQLFSIDTNELPLAFERAVRLTVCLTPFKVNSKVSPSETLMPDDGIRAFDGVVIFAGVLVVLISRSRVLVLVEHEMFVFLAACSSPFASRSLEVSLIPVPDTETVAPPNTAPNAESIFC